MLNIKNLKISRFFWTRITSYNKSGQINVILVKKNIFGGYVVINNFDHKIYVKNIDDILKEDSYNIIDASTTFSKSIEDANRRYQRYDSKLEAAINENLDRQKSKYETYIHDLNQKQSEQIQQQTYSFEQQQKKSIYDRLHSLQNDTKKVFEYEVRRDGYYVEYQTPNQIQKEHFGFTVIPQKKYYSNDNKISGNLDYYFKFLESEIDNSLIDQFNNLKQMYIELENRISGLSKDFSENKYLQVISYKTRFIIAFSEFIYSCLRFYKDKDISYYNSYNSYSSGDEEVKSIIFCSDLIGIGRNICANLIEKYMGNLEKEQFIKKTLPENQLEDQIENPKII